MAACHCCLISCGAILKGKTEMLERLLRLAEKISQEKAADFYPDRGVMLASDKFITGLAWINDKEASSNMPVRQLMRGKIEICERKGSGEKSHSKLQRLCWKDGTELLKIMKDVTDWTERNFSILQIMNYYI